MSKEWMWCLHPSHGFSASAGQDHAPLLESDSTRAFAPLFSFFISSLSWFPTEVLFSSSLKSLWHLHLLHMADSGKGWVLLFTSKENPFLANSCSTSRSTQLTFIIVFPGRNVKKISFLLLKTGKAGYRIRNSVWNCSIDSDINCLSLCISPCTGAVCTTVPGFSPDSIHAAETNKLAAASSSSNRAGKTEMVLQPVLAAPLDNTPGKTAPAFHSEPRKKNLMKKFCEWLLSLGPCWATTGATTSSPSASLLLQNTRDAGELHKP